MPTVSDARVIHYAQFALSDLLELLAQVVQLDMLLQPAQVASVVTIWMHQDTARFAQRSVLFA